jgi:hypothetical protein
MPFDDFRGLLNNGRYKLGIVNGSHNMNYFQVIMSTCLLNNNSSPIQFFIIYVLNQQLQSQLQTQHSVDTGNHTMDRHNIKIKDKFRQALEDENTLI